MDFEKAYDAALKSGLLPGYALLAGDNDKVLFTKTGGLQSLKGDSQRAFGTDTMIALASMSKLMTSVALMQAVDQGIVKLDEPVTDVLPSLGSYGIMTGFDDEKNEAITRPNTTSITLRMLLCYTSGYELDWLNPLIQKWRFSRGEELFPGTTLESKAAVPLIFEPGTGIAYGVGHDWAGRFLELKTGQNLESWMSTHIWTPLGIRPRKDMTFFPLKQGQEVADRLAHMTTLSDSDAPPAVHLEAHPLLGMEDCLGGAGGFGTPAAYLTFLQAVMRRDARLGLKPETWDEMFRPQFGPELEEAVNAYVNSTPVHRRILGGALPDGVRRSFSLVGMVSRNEVREGEGDGGRIIVRQGMTMWGGLPSTKWFIDPAAGVCGVACCQVLPSMSPPIMDLHEQFRREVTEKFGQD